MKITRIKCAQRDKRGRITDILVREKIDYVTHITSARGSVRGNHYHRKTVQWVYVLEGKLKLLTQMPDLPVVSTILRKGDLAMTVPLERHTMIAMEDSVFMVFTRGVRGGGDYEKDTYRLGEPLQV